MLESVLLALQGLSTVAKAMSAFDAIRTGLNGDSRTLIEELKENSRICFHIVGNNIDLGLLIPKFSTVEFDRLNTQILCRLANYRRAHESPPRSAALHTELSASNPERMDALHEVLRGLQANEIVIQRVVTKYATDPASKSVDSSVNGASGGAC